MARRAPEPVTVKAMGRCGPDRESPVGRTVFVASRIPPMKGEGISLTSDPPGRETLEGNLLP